MYQLSPKQYFWKNSIWIPINLLRFQVQTLFEWDSCMTSSMYLYIMKILWQCADLINGKMSYIPYQTNCILLFAASLLPIVTFFLFICAINWALLSVSTYYVTKSPLLAQIFLSDIFIYCKYSWLPQLQWPSFHIFCTKCWRNGHQSLVDIRMNF